MSTTLAPRHPAERPRAGTARGRRALGPRHAVNAIMVALTLLAALVAVLPLVVILWHLLRTGAGALDLAFFTRIPRPVGEAGGGMANAIVGTLILIALAAAVGLPVGVGAGVYLAEHGATRLANGVRFLADVLNGLPSIVMGIFAWQFLVRPAGHFSALSGGVALGVMMVPMVARTTEEMVRVVPVSLREAALALGFPRWRTSLAIVLRTASAGIVTGALVALARIAGETAPLLFTAFGNQFWSTSVTQPIAALPLQIFTYAISPYDDWHRLAWAGALVLIALILVISLIARVATRARFVTGGGD
ncbi:MAG TPA: phosphate ABC transporter permease PstA [Gemmatimonadaceae bacterium]